VAHIIIIGGDGVGPGGSAKSRVEYTPDHSVSAVEQMRKVKRVEKMLERINDFLYGSGVDPYPDDHD
jgi:hypothetical protein